MKKVFSVLVVAVALVAVSCNNAAKPAEEVAVEATEVVAEEAAAACACGDSCAVACGDSCACAAEVAVEEAAQ